MDWDSKVMVLNAVKTNPWLYGKASDALRMDRDIVIHAVRRFWRALQYVLPIFKDDNEIVDIAVRQNAEAIEYASARFRLLIE
jgi:hypothetical protein